MSFKDGKIYKITSKQTDKIYIGSTRLTLERRFTMHKCDYKVYLKLNKGGCSSIELLKYGDCEIGLIEGYPCENKTALERREGVIQLENRSIIVNKRIAGQTKKEWYAENKEKLLEYANQHYLDNRDKILEYSTKYYLDNKKKIYEYKTQYYLDNKEKFSAPFKSDCGSIVQHCWKARHLKTKGHISYISGNINS
jgi:hypothetical protein